MVSCGRSLQEYPINTGVFQDLILGPLFSLVYLNDLSFGAICYFGFLCN